MGAILKYVNTPAGPVLFPNEIQHDTFKAMSPTSAGAVVLALDDDYVKAYGGSTSLNLKSVPDQDTAEIRWMLGIKKAKP